MRIPKLKYFYFAMRESEYEEFCRTRRLLINEPVTINVGTGQVSTPRPFLYLYSRPTVADTRYRQLAAWELPVYVLRIPGGLVPRDRLEATEDPEGMWLCRSNLEIAHCGVERFEMPAESMEPQFTVVAQTA